MLGTIASAMLAGAMLTPTAGSAAVHMTDGPAPPPDPFSAIAGFGLSKAGDLIHAVPIFGPAATGALEQPFCAVRDIPIIGAIASSAISQFDKDQNQHGCLEIGTFPAAGTSGSPAAGTSGSPAAASAPRPGARIHPAPPSAAPALPVLPPAAPLFSFSPPPAAPALPALPAIAAPAAPQPAAPAWPMTPLNPVPPVTPAIPALSASPPPAAPAPAAPAPAAPAPAAPAHAAPAHAAPPHAAPAAHGPKVEAHFPKVPFRMRDGRGQGQSCLVASGATDVVLGQCATATVWSYQASTKEVRLMSDPSRCLTAPTGNMQLAAVVRCDSVKPWQRQWL